MLYSRNNTMVCANPPRNMLERSKGDKFKYSKERNRRSTFLSQSDTTAGSAVEIEKLGGISERIF